MRRGLLACGVAVVGLLALPAAAAATRPATEQEISEFRAAAKAAENATCAVAEALTSSSCPPPRPDYEPLITEARVSTIEETWATAYIMPAPRLTEGATALFRKETPVEGDRSVWHITATGSGCELRSCLWGEATER